MRARERDAAFSDYVAARRSHLRRYAYALCGDWDRAEDLLQIALTKLYVAWPRVERTAAPDAYVRRIITTTSVDESRRPWRRETPGLEPDDDRPGAGTAPSPEPTDGPDLRAALAGLTDMQRRVVVLRHWLDLSVEDTAAELGIAVGTAKAHHARALVHLRTALDVRTSTTTTTTTTTTTATTTTDTTRSRP